MKRCFRRFLDDRFALTALQNRLFEVRTYAELVEIAQREREHQPAATEIAAMHAPAAPVASGALPVPVASIDFASQS